MNINKVIVQILGSKLTTEVQAEVETRIMDSINSDRMNMPGGATKHKTGGVKCEKMKEGKEHKASFIASTSTKHTGIATSSLRLEGAINLHNDGIARGYFDKDGEITLAPSLIDWIVKLHERVTESATLAEAKRKAERDALIALQAQATAPV